MVSSAAAGEGLSEQGYNAFWQNGTKEGHLGFAVALEMLKGMNLFWHLGLFWTPF